jgi:hypothetical protein
MASAGPLLGHARVRSGLARLGRLQSEARLGRLGWAARKMEKGEGKEEVGWAGLIFQLGFGPLPNWN